MIAGNEYRSPHTLIMSNSLTSVRVRSYHEPKEVVLAAGPSPKLSDLVELASKATGIAVDDVVLAKYVISKQDQRSLSCSLSLSRSLAHLHTHSKPSKRIVAVGARTC